MRLSYNMPALIMHMIQNQALDRQSGDLNRISSGCKINSAADNPTGLVQRENISIQVKSLETVTRNVQDGVSMLQSAEGGLNEITSMVQRVRQLTLQAGDGSFNDRDRQKIQGEIDQMLDGINEMANNTEFNGFKLLGQNKTISMTVGTNAGDDVNIPQIDLTNGSDGVISDLYKIKTDGGKDILSGDTDSALSIIDSSLNTIVSLRSKYGALENRFTSSYNNMQELNEKMTDAYSSISDSDMAEEMMNYSKESIVIQASNAMIAQANKLPQDVLQIIQNFRK
ncbi:flagellin [Clostridium autoethanogenum]|uniref:Flagellin n=1 Tax=Clostridium autoethanogenum DSM 10061 TaxID=1341692 RepID=A0ABM5NXM3_9CLOT|nr:flagellin [Clostridium autoethanogenum]AGY77311.1 flagellin [Clostridium autoethanogenum DSM 10061]ALU37453.1 Flagellin domain protein [Clostridium autoethanogenum DSM 10061]OVY49100.1 Flagellin [Clostridium autoethanogenum]